MDPQRLVQRLVERGAVVMELLPQLLLRLSVGEVGRRHIDALMSPLRARRRITRGREAGVRRRGLGAVPQTPGHHVAVPSPHERPAWDSGADVGRLAHWSHPGGGTSSSGISTAVAWELPVRAGSGGATMAIAACCASVAAGACRASTAVTACRAASVVGTCHASAACRASAAAGACCAPATTCCCSVVAAAGCGSETSATPRESLLAAVAVLAAARDALDERRLVGTAASVLSTFAGARGARSASPCEHVNKEVRPPQLKYTTPRGTTSHLRELPRGLRGRCGCGWRGCRRTPRRLHCARGCPRRPRGHLCGAHRHLRGPRRLCH
jgi:hypothetical protein